MNDDVTTTAGQFLQHLFGSDVPAMPLLAADFARRLRPFYQRNGITIFRGDCRRILPFIPAVFFDLVATDPPYGICYDTNADGRKGNTRRRYKPVLGDDRPFDPSHLLAFPRICLWGANYYASNLPRSTKWIVWDKRQGKGQNDGSDCEIAWTQGLPGVSTRTFYHYWNGAARASERGEPRRHPTQKPIALMRWVLGLYPAVKSVVDPYMGVGTTLIAAKQLGIPAIGIERDEQYCRAAAERVEATSRLVN